MSADLTSVVDNGDRDRAGTAKSPQSFGSFKGCANAGGNVPIGWAPYFPPSSIIVLRAVAPFTDWQWHGVRAMPGWQLPLFLCPLKTYRRGRLRTIRTCLKMASEDASMPTTWTILQHDGPDHLGLRHNAFPEFPSTPAGFGERDGLSLLDRGADGARHCTAG